MTAPTTLKEPTNPHIGEMYGEALGKGIGPIPHFDVSQFAPAVGTIVVQRADPEAVTEAGIIIPDGAQEIPNIGRVVACPSNSVLEPKPHTHCPYHVGDWVLFRNGGVELPLAGANNLVVLQFRGAIDDEILGRFFVKGVANDESAP